MLLLHASIPNAFTFQWLNRCYFWFSFVWPLCPIKGHRTICVFLSISYYGVIFDILAYVVCQRYDLIWNCFNFIGSENILAKFLFVWKIKVESLFIASSSSLPSFFFIVVVTIVSNKPSHRYDYFIAIIVCISFLSFFLSHFSPVFVFSLANFYTHVYVCVFVSFVWLLATHILMMYNSVNVMHTILFDFIFDFPSSPSIIRSIIKIIKRRTIINANCKNENYQYKLHFGVVQCVTVYSMPCTAQPIYLRHFPLMTSTPRIM